MLRDQAMETAAMIFKLIARLIRKAARSYRRAADLEQTWLEDASPEEVINYLNTNQPD
jgi:hypothetical protein